MITEGNESATVWVCWIVSRSLAKVGCRRLELWTARLGTPGAGSARGGRDGAGVVTGCGSGGGGHGPWARALEGRNAA